MYITVNDKFMDINLRESSLPYLNFADYIFIIVKCYFKKMQNIDTNERAANKI